MDKNTIFDIIKKLSESNTTKDSNEQKNAQTNEKNAFSSFNQNTTNKENTNSEKANLYKQSSFFGSKKASQIKKEEEKPKASKTIPSQDAIIDMIRTHNQLSEKIKQNVKTDKTK